MDLLTPLTTTVISEWQLGKGIDEARNESARIASDNKADFLFFLDWDVIPHPQTLHQLVQRALNEPDIDVFSGVYCCRHRDWPAPLVYFGDDYKIGYDWTVGDLLTTGEHDLSGFGMGLTLIRPSLFAKLDPIPGKPWFHTSKGETEDLYFLKRARREANAKFLVDTSLLAWHIDPDTGVAYNLPHDSSPVKRWRALNPEIKETHVPYNCEAVSLMNIGQRVSDCSVLPGVA